MYYLNLNHENIGDFCFVIHNLKNSESLIFPSVPLLMSSTCFVFQFDWYSGIVLFYFARVLECFTCFSFHSCWILVINDLSLKFCVMWLVSIINVK